MSNLMNHDTDQKSLFRQGVSPRTIILQLRARAIEGNHGVFHAANEAHVHRLSCGIGIIERKSGVDIQRVNDHLGGIL